MQDTDGDLKADKTEVIVTGFGRTDTHELPNSFTLGTGRVVVRAQRSLQLLQCELRRVESQFLT